MSKKQLNLFTVLQKGDREIAKLKQEAYMIIGLSRNGKSCFFNHLLTRSMIGSIDPRNKQKIIYAPDPDTNSGIKVENYAEMGNTFTATTLYPNIGMLGECSLTDMAGFEQNRNQVGILAVSYFLMSCFQKLKRAKFIVVISEMTLFSDNIQLIIKSFEQLINLFTIEKLSPELWKNFMNSIIVVVSYARENREHYKERLEIIMEQMKDTSLESVKHRQLIVQILETVTIMNHVEIFLQAKQGRKNIQINSTTNLQFENWQFFDLQKAKEYVKGEVLVIPFNKDFDKLSKTKKDFEDRFNNIIKTRVRHFLMVNRIFSVALETLRSSWKAGISNVIDATPIFKEINDFLKESYPYDNDVEINQEQLISDNTEQNIFEIVVNSLSIYNLCSQLYESTMEKFLSFDQKMKIFKQIIPQMVNCLVPICTMKSQHEQLKKINFLLIRGFTEFSKFYQLKKEIIDNIGREMIDTNNKEITSEISKLEHFQCFILNMNKEVLMKYFNSIPHLNRCEQLMQMFWQLVGLQGKGDRASNEIQLNNLKLQINSTKAQFFMEKGFKWEVLKENGKVIRLLCNQLQLTRQKYSNITLKSNIENQVTETIEKIKTFLIYLGGQFKIVNNQAREIEDNESSLKIVVECKKNILDGFQRVQQQVTKIKEEKSSIDSEYTNLQTQNAEYQVLNKATLEQLRSIQQVKGKIQEKKTTISSDEGNIKLRCARVEEQNVKAEDIKNIALIEEENKIIVELKTKIQQQRKIIEGLQFWQILLEKKAKIEQKKKDLEIRIMKLQEVIYGLIHNYSKIQTAQKNISKNKIKEIEDFHFKIVEKTDKMAQHLLTFNSQQLAMSRKFALSLCDISKNVYLSESIFQDMIKTQLNSNNRQEVIDKYFQFCKKWGKIEAASRLLFQKRHIYRKKFDYSNIKKTSQEMKALIDSSEQIKKQSRNLLQSLDLPLQNKQISYLLLILDQISAVPIKLVLQDSREQRKIPFEVKAYV